MKVLVAHKYGRKKLDEDYSSYTHKECADCKQVKKVSEFNKVKNKRTKLGWTYSTYCKTCSNKQCSKYGENNKPKRNSRLRNWRKLNPEQAKANDLKRYGLTPEKLEELKKQNDYRCWICNTKTDKLVIDHCHESLKVRGMLCVRCNVGLGFLDKGGKDFFEKIQEYLAGKNPHAKIITPTLCYLSISKSKKQNK